MNEERKKVLEMLAAGKITVEEAERLLAALEENTARDKSGAINGQPKYLRVQIEPKAGSHSGDRVNVRVPINLIRAGLKWASFIPKHKQGKIDTALKERGIDFNLADMKPEDLDELILNLNDLQVDVDGDEVVKVFCE
jgi:hypothetical protein